MMNVDNSKLEKISALFRKTFNSLFLQGYIEITHTIINQQEKYVSTLPSDYQWHLDYWHHDLDLMLSERCRKGIQAWKEYSNDHKYALCKKWENIIKIDLCTKIQDGYELFSVSREQEISLSCMIEIIKIKATVSHYAAQLRKSCGDSIHLPLRGELMTPILSAQKELMFPDYPYSFFNGITFTQKEMHTIKLILELNTIKEIATYHGCSLTAEKRRIERIKQKLNCDNLPLSKLFRVLKNTGIAAACLDSYITYQ